jgi:hypothetical protein
MALDPNIALGVKSLELPNQLAQYGQLAQIQNAQNQNQLAQYQLGSAQRAEKSQNMLADAYAQSTDLSTGKIDYNKLTGLLAAGGGGAQLPAIQKSRMEGESANTKLLADKLALLPQAYKMADTPESYLTLHKSIHADPVLGPWLNSIGATPEKGLASLQNAIQTGKFEDLRMGSMQSVSQLLDSIKPQVVAPGSSLVQGGKAIFTAPEKAKTTDLMANYEAAKAQGFPGTIFDYERRIKEAGRAPVQPVAPSVTTIADPTNPGKSIVVDARTYRGGGAGSPGVIGAGGKDEKTAVSEQQAAYNIGRVLTAADQINKITKTDPSALKPGMGEAAAASMGMSGTANLARNANRQIVSGAQRDALDALLYLATGAAYNKEQLEGQMAAYIPSYTDAPETVAAKKTRMTDLIGSAKIRAGKAWTPQMESAMKSLTEPGASSTASGKVTPAADGKWKDL